MKKLIGIVLCFFLGHLTAKQIKVVSATKHIVFQYSDGGRVLLRSKYYSNNPRPSITNRYSVILDCKNFNSVVLDSICIDNIREKLILNSNVTIDTLHHTYSIIMYSPGRPNPPVVNNINIPDHILYEYRRKKYTLLIKEIAVYCTKNTSHKCRQ